MYTTIKKVSKGLMAAVLGLTMVLAGSAFKGDSNKKAPQRFKYIGTTFTEAAVENLSNWSHDEDAPECDRTPQQACVIIVDSQFVNPNGTLKSTLNLTAAQYSSSTNYYVSGSSDSSMDIENRTAQ